MRTLVDTSVFFMEKDSRMGFFVKKEEGKNDKKAHWLQGYGNDSCIICSFYDQ